MEEKTVNLYLGCGPHPIHPQHLNFVDETWIFSDKYVKDPTIQNIDAVDLSDFKDGSVNNIYHSHLWEHLSYKESEQALKEWYRVLKKGGTLTVNVPDMEWLAAQLLYNQGIEIQTKGYRKSNLFNTDEMLMEVIYGNQDHDGEFHKTGFTKTTLENKLKSVGFENIKIKQIFEAHEMGVLLAQATK